MEYILRTCTFRKRNFRKLLVAEVEINVECSALRIDMGARKLWTREPFSSTHY